MRKFPLYLARIALVALSVRLPAAYADPPPPATGASLTDRLARDAERFERLGLSGVIAARHADNPPAIVGVGLADRRARTPHTTQTLFDIGTVSAQFTAAAVLRLRMAGQLDLDTPIRDLLPGVPRDKSEITVEHLLTHRSGLPEFVPMHAGDANHMDRALARILETPLDTQPGQTTRFSASGYTLLAMIIARVSGENFPDYIRREVFKASGMRDAHFLHDTDVNADAVAMRYNDPAAIDPVGSALTNRWSWETRGVSGVVANAEDLLTFIHATRRGPFFDDDARAIFWRADSGGRSPAGLHYESAAGTTRILASGQTNGFEASIAIFPQEDITVVLLANTNGVLTRVGPEIEKAILFPDRNEPRVAEHSETLTRLLGVYALDDGSTITITANDGEAVLSPSGQTAMERLAHGDRFEPSWGQFYRETNPRALEAASAICAADIDAVRAFMPRGDDASNIASFAEQLRSSDPPVTARRAIGTVSLTDSMVSFVELSDHAPMILRWLGRNLVDANAATPENLLTVRLTEVRPGLFEGPGADGVSTVRFSCEQRGIAPFDEIKLLATKSAAPVIARRIDDRD